MSALVPVAAAMSGHSLGLNFPHELERAAERAEAEHDLEAMAGFDLQIWAPLGVDEKLTTMVVENVGFSWSDDPGTWADPPAAGRLGEIAVSTLVITGAQDVPEISAVGELLVSGIAGARGRDRECGPRRTLARSRRARLPDPGVPRLDPDTAPPSAIKRRSCES